MSLKLPIFGFITLISTALHAAIPSPNLCAILMGGAAEVQFVAPPKTASDKFKPIFRKIVENPDSFRKPMEDFRHKNPVGTPGALDIKYPDLKPVIEYFQA